MIWFVKAITWRKIRALQVPPVVPYRALGNFSIINYFTNGWHRKCSVIYLTQTYCKVAKSIQDNCNYFCFFRANLWVSRPAGPRHRQNILLLLLQQTTEVDGKEFWRRYVDIDYINSAPGDSFEVGDVAAWPAGPQGPRGPKGLQGAQGS